MTRTRMSVAHGVGLALWLCAALVLAQPRAERIELTTADELKLTAYWYTQPSSEDAPAVVLIHNPGSAQGAWQPMVMRLLGAGFRVLSFDLRGHGESKEATQDVYERLRRREQEPYFDMIHDVDAAVQWLNETMKLPPERIALMGGAYGANLALQAGARNQKLAAVVALSPSKLFFADPLVEHARKYGKRPLFIIITKQYLSHGATEIQELNGDNEDFRLKVFPRYEAYGTQLLNLNWNVEGLSVEWLREIMEMPSS